MIWPSFEKCFPLIKERSSAHDPPFMSPLVKYLLKLWKRAIQKRNTEASLRLQERINKLIRDNQLYAVKQENYKQKMG